MQQLQSINIEVPQTANMERHDSGKAAYGDDPDGRSFGDDQVSIIFIFTSVSVSCLELNLYSHRRRPGKTTV
jgi:hypothetical protein